MSSPGDSIVRGPIREVPLDVPCPGCARSTLTFRALSLDLPFFGDAVQTTLVCGSCGYRNADVLLSRDSGPIRIELDVTMPADLSARVARSSSGTIRIPSLGATMEPGPRSEAFITNVEGVLHRFRDVARGAAVTAVTPEERISAQAAVERFERLIGGLDPFTIVLEDPTGNSDILHPDVRRRTLTREEASELRAPAAPVDLSDLARGDAGTASCRASR
ncbi:MAG TPA: ZPR1 zinc finger domain-containing protein [Thermoplasmata archaeon]|nr:ZPR1 zinc finger domain-containing protein [Thermoplasmata archaeon]